MVKLKHGIYETIITQALAKRLAQLPKERFSVEKHPLDADEETFSLALFLAKRIAKVLLRIKGNDESKRRAQFCNQLLEVIANQPQISPDEADKLIETVEELVAIRDTTKSPLVRPNTPLSTAALFTGATSDLTLENELKREILTADRIDILCSFIRWSGLRLLLPALKEAADNGIPVRIITTSYLGVTDLRAVEALRGLRTAQILVSYDTKHTRLHAKSYIFHRDNTFGTAYIGSSNISAPALTSGLEWNLKISQFESPYLWERICATFETYLHAPEFSPYTDDSSRDRLARALKSESGEGRSSTEPALFMDVTPYAYQEEILDSLTAERELHNRHKNLVVAATGTGKTVIAAFDFKRFLNKNNSPASFLFIAHREEILDTSLATFRHILRDQNFGELFVGAHKPTNLKTLFCSIQSLNADPRFSNLPSDYYDYIVVDEFHHAAAKSYERLLSHFAPKELLALTATPERHDGLDILSYFDNRIAAEIRLPDAINRKLLSPFHYFGISDCVDLSSLRWRNGGYDKAELSNVYCENAQRAELVVQKMREILLDVSACRALCFCVSQEHAAYMSEFFNQRGIHALALTASSALSISITKALTSQKSTPFSSCAQRRAYSSFSNSSGAAYASPKGRNA